MKNYVNLFNEIGMLAKTPRSGFAFLGSGKQSVAEHSFRMALIAYTLATLIEEPVDTEKLLLMCLLHDLPEARTGDLNYVNKKYVIADEAKVVDEIKRESPLGLEIGGYIEEYQKKESIESLLAKDADQIELLLCLKEEYDTGNKRAMEWFDNGVLRLRTEVGKKLAAEIKETPADAWWLKDKEDPHWVHGGKE